jgi:hypothetical protein
MKATCWVLDRSASGGTGTLRLGSTPPLPPAGLISGVTTVVFVLYRGDSDVCGMLLRANTCAWTMGGQ